METPEAGEDLEDLELPDGPPLALRVRRPQVIRPEDIQRFDSVRSSAESEIQVVHTSACLLTLTQTTLFFMAVRGCDCGLITAGIEMQVPFASVRFLVLTEASSF